MYTSLPISESTASNVLPPHKSTAIGFSVVFECLQSFWHAFLNA